MTPAELAELKRLLAELKRNCNRYVNGVCSTRGCLRRGGWNGEAPVDFTKATCERHEQATALETLIAAAEECERMRAALHQIEDHHNETEGWRDIARAALEGKP